MPRILILGGFGNAGRHIASLLRREGFTDLVLAGRNPPASHPDALKLDATNPRDLTAALAGVQLLINAASTLDHTATIAEAALHAGIDYFDIHLSSPRKWAGLRALQPRIEAAGRCFLTDGGYHPGLPAALIRYAALQFDTLRSAVVSSVMRLPWKSYRFSPESVAEFTAELHEYRPRFFAAKRWQQSWAQTRMVDFGPPHGRQRCAPMALEELEGLPTLLPPLEETGFYANAFDAFTSNVVIPLGVLVVNGMPSATPLFQRLFLWSARMFARPPFGVVLLLEAEGMRGGEAHRLRLRVEHEDGYVLTAVPAVACLLQYFDGTARRPGLHCQASIVEPVRFLTDLRRLGLTVKEN